MRQKIRQEIARLIKEIEALTDEDDQMKAFELRVRLMQTEGIYKLLK